MPELDHTVLDAPAHGMRLDRYVAERLALLPRSQVKARNLSALVNGRPAKLSFPVRSGDILRLAWDEPEPSDLIPEDIPLNVLYEDRRTVVIDKVRGMVVHPGAGNRQGTLANALCHRRLLRGGPEPAGFRPGIVHRLDKDTSGVMIAAYDDEALAFLAGQFKSGRVRKRYLAIACGIPRESSGRIETFIARDSRNRKRFAVCDRGKHSLTLYSVLKTWKRHSLLLLRPRTGRTHQIRVHLRHLGHPVFGDPIYGLPDPSFPDAGLMLHARSLRITLPGEEEARKFKARIPDHFVALMRTLDGE